MENVIIQAAIKTKVEGVAELCCSFLILYYISFPCMYLIPAE